jgi:hypothetical protein
MTRTQYGPTGRSRFASGGGVLHVNFSGHSFDISAPGLDLTPNSSSDHVKRAAAEFLGVPTYRLDDYVVTRFPNGNLAIMPAEEAGLERR